MKTRTADWKERELQGPNPERVRGCVELGPSQRASSFD
jgi:hypothetical protein